MLLQAPKVGFIFPNTKCLGTPCSHRLLLKRLERDKQLWDTPHDVFSRIYLLLTQLPISSDAVTALHMAGVT